MGREKKSLVWDILIGIIKIIFKIFLWLLYGCTRIAEIILQQFNKRFKDIIS